MRDRDAQTCQLAAKVWGDSHFSSLKCNFDSQAQRRVEMVQVYTEPLYRRHFSSLLGWPVLVRVGLLCIAIAVSLVVAYATGGFWIKITPTLAQATVHYTGDALIVIEVRLAPLELRATRAYKQVHA